MSTGELVMATKSKISLQQIPVLYFNPFQAPECDKLSLPVEDVRPGMVIAVEKDWWLPDAEEAVAVPAVALGVDHDDQCLGILNYEGDIEQVSIDIGIRIFDLGETVSLAPLSSERAESVWNLISGPTTDVVRFALQRIALHYAMDETDLNQAF